MGSLIRGECTEWTGATRNGYGCKRLGSKTVYVHRVAFEEANGRKPEGVVRHKCDNRLCYNPTHLEEGSKLDNSRDMVERGRSVRGERHRDAILNEDDVRKIRAMRDVRSADVAEMFGISRQNVNSIWSRRSWKHVS